MHDGPTYAYVSIHIGHAITKTLQDLIIISKTLSGYDAHVIHTWDCNGLSFELQVENTHGNADQII
ncbi:class I tRNA ligase family protein [Francisella tularensis subsp. holarctica]|nr:class I tRNA ligase family protein [Francisella tularensis subsp. holarctica]